MRRRCGKKVLIDVLEYIKDLGTTQWIVPKGTTQVDVCVVGSGLNGGRNPGNYSVLSGAGGNGGEVKNYYNIPVIPGQAIDIHIEYGNSPAANYFFNLNYAAYGGAGKAGGQAVYSGNGNPGENGVYAFDDPTVDRIWYGAGGGSGASMVVWSTEPETGYGGVGGVNGGGAGGNATGAESKDCGSGAWPAENATYYGGGGGGGSLAGYPLSAGSGGIGHQGIVILRYQKYK